MEGGLIQGKPRPDRVAELGIGASVLGKTTGLGVVLERVARPSAGVEIASEYKLDVVVHLRKQRFVAGFGMGVRRLDVDGPKASRVWGVDLILMRGDYELARAGHVGVGVYFSWTFGLYRGELYTERFGDMAYPTRDYSTMASSYVVGLQTTIHTNP